MRSRTDTGGSEFEVSGGSDPSADCIRGAAQHGVVCGSRRPFSAWKAGDCCKRDSMKAGLPRGMPKVTRPRCSGLKEARTHTAESGTSCGTASGSRPIPHEFWRHSNALGPVASAHRDGGRTVQPGSVRQRCTHHRDFFFRTHFPAFARSRLRPSSGPWLGLVWGGAGQADPNAVLVTACCTKTGSTARQRGARTEAAAARQALA